MELVGFPFMPGTPLRPTLFGEHSFLNTIQGLSDSIKVKDTNHGYENLCNVINFKIVSADVCIAEFQELCEAFISILYFSLVYPKSGRREKIATLIASFLDKWFVAYDNYDINQLISSIHPQYQNLSFASVLLLINFNVLSLTAESAWTLCQWRAPSICALQWLKETLSCREDVHKNLTRILYKSLYYMECKEEIDFDNCYLKAYSSFLSSCSSYATNNYERSLEVLNSVDLRHCGHLLRGWVLTLKGLNLEYLGKPQSALMEYRESLCSSADCFYSLYFSSRIFKKSSLPNAELEVLELLTTVNVDNLRADSSLQTTLMYYHLPIPSELHLRALWLLASSLHSYQKWSVARKIYFSLLNKWDEECTEDSPRNDRKSSILLPRDRIPELPNKTCVRMGYISSLLFSENFEEVEAQIGDLDDLAGFLNEEFEQLTTREKLGKLANIMSHLLVAESIYQQNRYKESLELCSKVTISVEMMRSSVDSWNLLIFLTKNYLYKLLTLLYGSSELNMRENALHFRRLQHNISEMLTQMPEVTADDDITCRSVFENAKMVLKARVEELCKVKI